LRPSNSANVSGATSIATNLPRHRRGTSHICALSSWLLVPGSGRPRCGDRATPGPSAPRPSHAGIGSRGRRPIKAGPRCLVPSVAFILLGFASGLSLWPDRACPAISSAPLQPLLSVERKLLARRRVWPLRTHSCSTPQWRHMRNICQPAPRYDGEWMPSARRYRQPPCRTGGECSHV
jgi:hypothetical protein